ncbi:MAG: hypothetical protein ACAI25_08855 [Planctomycetota bacterium]
MKTLVLSRLAPDGTVAGELSLPVHSGKDPVALLVEAAEDLCIVLRPDGAHEIAASDVAPFVIPRLAELLDPDNDELRFVVHAGAAEKLTEHTVKRAIAKGEWPTNGSLTLEAAVLAVKLADVAREAAKGGESILLRWKGAP